MDGVRAMDYVALQKSGDIDDPRAMGQYLKGGFVPEIPDDLVTAIVEGFRGDPRRNTTLFFQQSGGAIGRVTSDATAFPQRDAMANMMTVVGWPQGDDPSAHISWIRGFWSGLEPFTHGFYVNDPDPDLSRRAIVENYRQNHDRLVRVKNRYDPANLFRLNANVEPTV